MLPYSGINIDFNRNNRCACYDPKVKIEDNRMIINARKFYLPLKIN